MALQVSGCVTDTGIYMGKHVIDRGSAKGETTKEGSENVVHLNDGSNIRGKILNQDRSSITIQTKYTTMKIEKKNIKEIKYK